DAVVAADPHPYHLISLIEGDRGRGEGHRVAAGRDVDVHLSGGRSGGGEQEREDGSTQKSNTHGPSLRRWRFARWRRARASRQRGSRRPPDRPATAVNRSAESVPILTKRASCWSSHFLRGSPPP